MGDLIVYAPLVPSSFSGCRLMAVRTLEVKFKVGLLTANYLQVDLVSNDRAFKAKR